MAAKDEERGTRPGASFSATGSGMGERSWVAAAPRGEARAEELLPRSERPAQAAAVPFIIYCKQQQSPKAECAGNVGVLRDCTLGMVNDKAFLAGYRTVCENWKSLTHVSPRSTPKGIPL